jgi:flavodoxin
MKTLIIYYSLTGHTQKIAEALAIQCKADSERIQDRRIRSGVFGTLRTAYEALFSRPGKIRYVSADPGQYDLLILGVPIWMMKLAPPMRSYILKEKHRFNRVAFFCTEGSSGGSRVFLTMQRLCAKQPVATLEVKEADIKSGQYSEKIDNFVNSCQRAEATSKRVTAA